MPVYILAHDIGTSGNKASVFDENGRLIASASVGYPTKTPGLGWMEQSADDWYRAVCEATRQVLSGLDAEAAGAWTGTYGLFRDLSAPFGVAVLVPLFTNTVASGIAAGTAPATAAVSSIRFLSLVEIACVAAGIAVVCLLPVLRKK